MGALHKQKISEAAHRAAFFGLLTYNYQKNTPRILWQAGERRSPVKTPRSGESFRKSCAPMPGSVGLDVFAVSFTASPITLAMLSDTAIRAISPTKWVPGIALYFSTFRCLLRIV